MFLHMPRCYATASWPREESNLRTQLRRLPLYPLSYGAERREGISRGSSLRCAGSVAVAQLVELRVVVPVAAGSSPVRHPCPSRSGCPGTLSEFTADGGALRLDLDPRRL